MLDFKFRRLEQHRVGGTADQMLLEMPAPRSPSGKVYQYSPNPDATPRLFLLGGAPADRTISAEDRIRMQREPGPGETVCPYSGYIGPDKEFVHFDDVQAITKQIEWEVAADIEDHLAKIASNFNRQNRGGLISLKMEVKPGRRPPPLIIREDLLRDLECDVCRRGYGVYAIALFCPDCGSPNLALHFNREKDLVGQQVALADEQSAAGRSELAYRLMGNAHEDVLTAFETTLKTVYVHLVRQNLPDSAPELCNKGAIKNAFQNIERSKEKFTVLAIEPFAGLSEDDLNFLQTNIQKRHVLGHNLGIADEHYAELTQTEQPGQTVGLVGAEISRFADICSKVVADLEVHLCPHCSSAL